MNSGKKIGFLLLLIGSWGILLAQTDGALLPFSNKLLLNPSFAGLNKNTNVWTGIYFMAENQKNLNNEFFTTWDSWSEKLDGGVAISFHQGLTGNINTSTTGLGFTFTKPFKSTKNGALVPSINISYRGATKHWFAAYIDGILNEETEPPSPPGEEFLRYNIFQPKLGILWVSPIRQIGLSASFPLNINIAESGDLPEKAGPQLIFYYAQNQKGKQNGLISQPYRASPEIVILYSNQAILSRAGLRFENVNNTYAIFLQNNYTSNFHGLGLTYGWRFGNFELNLTGGSAYSFSTEDVGGFGEATLRLVIPYVHFDKKNPWAPVPKSFN